MKGKQIAQSLELILGTGWENVNERKELVYDGSKTTNDKKIMKKLKKLEKITENVFNDMLPEISAEVSKTVQKIEMIAEKTRRYGQCN